ncbi:MAG: EamA family transporter RarD [Rubrivivax sp.]|nr:EamA family transporter RarD [Rubrivivax sp.]
MPPGLIAAALAYICWGLFPLYLKQVAHVPAVEVVAHRSLWSLVFVVVLLAAWRRMAWWGPALRNRRTLAVFAASALLLSLNWGLYVWAVAAGRIVDASLGYFINPLFNVLLGVLVLKERPRPLQWAAVGLAACGVLWLIVGAGEWPWIALVLAGSFGLYGLLRKTAPLGAAEGLALETLMQAPLAAGLLAWWAWQGTGALTLQDPATSAWLLLAGPFTAIPLLLFASGARQLPLATMGLLQYLGPTIQFALGVFVYGEPFSAERAVGFALIWAALALYSAESLRGWRRRVA